MAVTTNSLNITNSGIVGFNSSTGLFSESPLTQYDVLVGGASNAITSVSPSTSGFILTSNGVSASPSFQSISSSGAITTIDGDSGSMTPTSGVVTISGGATGLTTTASASTMDLTGTLVVGNGGTGLSSLATYELMAAGTTATGNMQQIALGTTGQLLTSNGSGALASFQTFVPPSTISTTYVNSSPYTVLSTDDIILMDTSLFASPMSVVLPATPTVDGQVWTVKDWSGAAASFNITITVSGGANIDGSTSFVINENYQSVSIAWSVSESTYSVVYDYQTALPGSITVTGDTGSITGTSLTIYSNNATQNAGSSVLFSNSGTISTLNVTDTNQNTLIGQGAGNASSAGNANTALGNLALNALTGGIDNTMLGFSAGALIQNGNDNVAVGFNALSSSVGDISTVAIGSKALQVLNGGSSNVAVGTASMSSSVTGSLCVAVGAQSLSTSAGSDTLNSCVGYQSLSALNGGSNNTAIGAQSGITLSAGNFNSLLGFHSGQHYTGAESSNVMINSPGILGESNTLRIGQATGTGNQQLSTAFIYGINGNTVSNTQLVTINSSTSQLGTIAVPSQNLTWTDEATSFTAVVNNGYYCTASLTVTLPSAPAQGQIVEILMPNASSVIIQAAAGQTIHFGSSASTIAGTATSTAKGDSVQLVYRSGGNAWWSFSSNGSWILA